MFRTLFTILVGLALVGEATAQTTPARKAPTTKGAAPRKATGSTTAQARRPAARPMTGRDDIGPGGNGAVGSTEAADGKGQGVYAAPGMPVNVDNPKKVEGYNGPAPTRARRGTTLTPR